MKKTILIIIVATLIIIGKTTIKKEEAKEKNLIESLGGLAYTLDGEKTDESYESLITNNEVNIITCEKGTIAVWDNTNKRIKLNNIQIPDYCTIDFKSKKKTLYTILTEGG